MGDSRSIAVPDARATGWARLRGRLGSLPPDRARLARRDHLILGLLFLWPLCGLFVDAWSHNNLVEIESFFTPYHAMLYSGALAVSAWVVWLLYRQRRAGRRGLGTIPLGYEFAPLGIPLFFIAGVGDLLWHARFGVERGLDVALSPTHLLLPVGGFLGMVGPIRAYWSERDDGRSAASLWAFLPVWLPAIEIVILCAYQLRYLSVFYSPDSWLADPVRVPAPPVDVLALPLWQIQNGRVAIGSVLVTNLLLLAPALFMLRRWRLPFGSMTGLFVAPAALLTGIQNFERGELVGVALVGGLLCDGLIRVLRPAPARAAAFRGFAVLAPLALWGVYLAIGRRSGELASWSPEMLGGALWWTAMSGFALGLLLLPPALPAETDPPPR